MFQSLRHCKSAIGVNTWKANTWTKLHNGSDLRKSFEISSKLYFDDWGAAGCKSDAKARRHRLYQQLDIGCIKQMFLFVSFISRWIEPLTFNILTKISKQIVIISFLVISGVSLVWCDVLFMRLTTSDQKCLSSLFTESISTFSHQRYFHCAWKLLTSKTRPSVMEVSP